MNEKLQGMDVELLQSCIGALIIVYLAFQLCSIKWRRLSNYIIYLELLFRLVILLKPNSRAQNAPAVAYLYEMIANFVSSYCGGRLSFFAAIIVLSIQIFAGILIYDKPLTIGISVLNITIILAYSIISSLLLITLHYVKRLQAKLVFTNVENSKLLHTMSQGLIIVSHPESPEESRTIMFSNRPAKNLVSSVLKTDERQKEDKDSDDYILRAKHFFRLQKHG